MAPATSMAKWSCMMAARICAVPAPRISCNGPTNNGKSSGPGARRVRPADVVNGISKCGISARYPSDGFPVMQRSCGTPMPSHLPVTILMEPRLWGITSHHVFLADTDSADRVGAGVRGFQLRLGARYVAAEGC